MTKLNEQQEQLFLDRYALKDENGEAVESTPQQMWTRVADAIGDTPEERKAFRELLDDFKFVPGGRILAGAGAEKEKTFYNCYVIPVETKRDAGADSREAIIDTIGTMVDIMSRGGGVGINWSVLRPSGAYLSRISGTSSGPIGWMDVASKAVGEVIQGGSRRGAAMFMLDDWHPDVLNFIKAKTEKGRIENANISVAISDEFMDRVNRQRDGLAGGDDLRWDFVFPDTTHPEYNLSWDGDLAGWKRRGLPVKNYGSIAVGELWNAISESAHASGEPGVVFIDRYNALSTANGTERIISVNPCGEQGLGAYSVCNLGAMNLNAYVTPFGFDGDPIFDFKRFRSDVKGAIAFLDNCIDKNFYFLPETEQRQRDLRRIGLGAMGLADALVRLGIRYGSHEAVAFTERVFREMKDAAIESSMDIATRKGPANLWSDSMWSRPYLAEYFERHEKAAPLRNIFLLTQAPTGTTSLLAGVNSGIEPYFNTGYWRDDRVGKRWIQPEAIEKLGPLLPDYVVTSQQITVEEHIAMQAAVQRYVDSSVSKTINAPKNQTVEETAKAFDLAYEKGLKGVAYYRDGSRNIQVLYHEDPNEVIAKLEQKIADLEGKLAFKQRKADEGFYPQTGNKDGNPDIGFGGFILVAAGHSDDCSGTVVNEEGCQKCYTCSWTAC